MGSVTFDSKSFNEAMKGFQKGNTWLQDVQVEFVDGPAEVDTLTLLRTYQADWDLEHSLTLASAMCLNRTVLFLKGKHTLMVLKYRGGDLASHFNQHPYLLDLLARACYGLMLKKLTPPSEDSATEDEN